MTTPAPSAMDGVQPICHPLCTVKDQITRTVHQYKLFLSGFVSTSGTPERKVTNSGGSGNLPYHRIPVEHPIPDKTEHRCLSETQKELLTCSLA